MTMFRRTNLAPEETAARRADGYVLVTINRVEFWAKGHLTGDLIRQHGREMWYDVVLEPASESGDKSIDAGVQAHEGQSFWLVPPATY